jgi:hypothetical protein
VPAQFKTDKASVDKALAHLLRTLRRWPAGDIEDQRCNGATTWHAAAKFDLDQTALEDASASALQPNEERTA